MDKVLIDYELPEVKMEIGTELRKMNSDILRFLINNCAVAVGIFKLTKDNVCLCVENLLTFRALYKYLRVDEKFDFMEKCLDEIEKFAIDKIDYKVMYGYRAINLIDDNPTTGFKDYVFAMVSYKRSVKSSRLNCFCSNGVKGYIVKAFKHGKVRKVAKFS